MPLLATVVADNVLETASLALACSPTVLVVEELPETVHFCLETLYLGLELGSQLFDLSSSGLGRVPRLLQALRSRRTDEPRPALSLSI